MLRRCTGEDYEVLLSWIADTEELYDFTGPVLTWPLALDQFDALHQVEGREDWTMVTSVQSRAALGHVEVTVIGRAARLSRVIVAPACRGRGWGRRLAVLAIEEARRRGTEEVTLKVFRSNEPAIRTYRSLGFTSEAEQARPDIVSMELPIPSTAGPRTR